MRKESAAFGLLAVVDYLIPLIKFLSRNIAMNFRFLMTKIGGNVRILF